MAATINEKLGSEAQIQVYNTNAEAEIAKEQSIGGSKVGEDGASDAIAVPSSEPADTAGIEDFSVFTVPQKRALILSASFVSWLSPLSAGIYYPALNKIAGDLHVSSSLINITVTMYLVTQIFMPMMVADFSEKAGRRPAYFVCFIVYILSNLFLAIQDNYVALLILRMVQAAGSSGFIVLSQGLIGDCTVSAERGKYVAYATLATLLSPSISPIVGGLLSQYADWHWIFWFLLILSVVTFIPVALFLPETSRKLVADGSIPPPRICDNITDRIRFRNRAQQGVPIDEQKQAELRRNHRFVIPNPIGTLVVLANLESALLLLALSLALACYYAIFTDISKSFYDFYGFTSFQVSLVALAVGAGGLIATFTTGYLVDWNYRRHAKRLGLPVERNRQADLSNFPIELARMQIGMPLLLFSGLAMIGYGWTLRPSVSVAGPIVFLFFTGYCVIASSQILNVLMVDIYPGKAADASAARNASQCLLGAASSAAIEPMIQAMGIGWAFTTLSLLFIVSLIGLVACMTRGIEWRKAQAEKDKRMEEKKELRRQQEQA